MAKKLIWDQDLIRRFWDEQSTRPEDYFSEKYGANIISRLQKFFVQGKILDFGCGAGGLLGPLLGTGEQVFGADISEESLSTVNNRFSANKTFAGAFFPNDLQGQGEKFSTVILSEVVEHLDDDSLNDVFRDVSSLMVPGGGGVLIVTTPNGEDLSASQIYCPNCDSEFHRWQHVRSWTAKTLRDFMENLGFEVVATVETNFSDTPGDVSSLLKTFVRVILKRKSRPHLAIIARKK